MKWKSHREVSKALAEDFNFQEKRFLEGTKHPDRVGTKKYGRDTSIEGVNVSFPHHKGTDKRIKSFLLKLRSHILKRKPLNHFSLGCLSHLIQDRVVFPSAHRKFEEFEKAVGKHDLEDGWRDEEIPLKDASILDELWGILKMANPDDPKMALKEGYLENKLILKSLLQDPDPPRELSLSYNRCKEKLKSMKKLRYAYWLLTYLNPLAPIFAIADGKAITNKNIVKRYSYVKKSAGCKASFSVLAVLLVLVAKFGGLMWLSVLPFFLLLSLLVVKARWVVLSFFLLLFLLAANVGLMWIPWISIPIIGQIMTAFMEIPDEISRNLKWFNFEKGEEKEVQARTAAERIELEAYDKERERRKAQRPIHPPAPGSITKLRYCPSCGKKLEPDWKVCGDCGKRLKESDVSKMDKKEKKIGGYKIVTFFSAIFSVIVAISVMWLPFYPGLSRYSVLVVFILFALCATLLILGSWANLRAMGLVMGLEAYDKEGERKRPQQPVHPGTAEPTAQLQYCPSCGKKLEPDWKVCGDCGKRLKESDVSKMDEKEYLKRKEAMKGITLFAGMVLLGFGVVCLSFYPGLSHYLVLVLFIFIAWCVAGIILALRAARKQGFRRSIKEFRRLIKKE